MNLNKREKILITIFINLCIVFMYNMYIYNPTVNEINEFKNIKKQLEYNDSVKAISQNNKVMLKSLEQQSIISILSNTFPKTITINSIKFQQEESDEKFKSIDIEVQIIGNMNDILTSLDKIENLRTSIYTKSIALDSTKDPIICTLYLRIYSL